MIAEAVVSAAVALAIVPIALGRRRRAQPAEHEGIAPSWTDPDDDQLAPGVAEWLADLHQPLADQNVGGDEADPGGDQGT